MVDQRVGRLGQRHRFLGERDGLVDLAPAGERLGPHRPPRDRRLEVVAAELLALDGELDSASSSRPELSRRAGEQRGGLRGVGRRPSARKPS